MKHFQVTWKLRTDGRTVSDDLNDLRNNHPEILQKMLDLCADDLWSEYEFGDVEATAKLTS